MRILLDTHIFLWFISDDERLPLSMQSLICDATNEVYLSVASIWESLIKYQLGPLPLPESPETYLPKQRAQHAIRPLDVDEQSIVHLATLPPLHRDPFDRLLVAQANQHGLTLATVDAVLVKYPVTTIGLS